jgi:hypothetical protein
MRLLDDSEAQSWLGQRGLPLAAFRKSGEGVWVDFELPKDSGVKTAIARSIAEMYSGCAEVMVDLDNWDVWASSTCMFLFDTFRSGMGTPRKIEDASAQVFSLAETQALEATIALALYFVWDAHVVGVGSGFRIVISHDEWMRVGVIDATDLQAVRDYFESFMELQVRERVV